MNSCKYIIIFSLTLISIICKGQNQINITEYMIYQPIINPASIASYNSLNGIMLYRNQWAGLDGAPTSGMIALNSPFKTTNLFFGGIVTFEEIGATKEIKVDGNITYKLKLTAKTNLSFAINGGVNHFKSDYDGLFFNDLDDPEFISGSFNSTLPDIGFGSYFFSKKYYIGFSIPTFFKHVNNLDQAVFDTENLHYFLHGGYSFKLTNKIDLNVSTFIKTVSGSPLQYDLNAQVLHNEKIGIGINYRSSEDVSIIVTFYLNERVGLSYAYDYGFSEVASFNRSTHEIMILFGLPAKKLLKITSPRF